MQELINVREENGKQVVSARELHNFLGGKKHMTQWIKPYVSHENDYGFVENIDYQRIDVGVNPTNGIPLTDYALTITMAKELSMLSKCENGKRARMYFIECEKKLKQNIRVLPNTYKEALLALVAAEEEKEKLLLENNEKQKEIEYKEDVIIGLTTDIDLAEKRQRISQIVKHNSKNYSDRYGLLYQEFDKKFHIDTKKRMENAKERGEIKKSVNRMQYICINMNKTNELYDVACKVFEGDFIQLLDEWKQIVS